MYRNDKLVWNFTKNGQLSVKSAYHMHQAIKARNECSSYQANMNLATWGSIWKLHVPNGIKIFIWRASGNISQL